MLNKYRIIVKLRKQYMSISGASFSIKDEVLKHHSFNQYQFISAMPESFMADNNNNKVKKENLVGMYYLDLKVPVDDEKLKGIVKKLTDVSFFEYIQVLPEHPDEPPSEIMMNRNSTPDFTSLQTYKDGDDRDWSESDIGIDIEYAWSHGITGQGVRIADIEWGFNFKHINLERDSFVELIPLSVHTHNEHGTSVAGVLYAKGHGFGITGMVHNADVLYGITEFTNGIKTRATNLAIGLNELRAGDVYLLEMQTGDAYGNGVPPDYDKTIWDIIEAATDAGIIMVVTAGNGGSNLDLNIFSEYRNRGDNGAIMVGAGTKIGRNRCDFSTYGKMVHVQGWGDWSVVTSGVGDLYNGAPLGYNNYTNTFSGTSSAGPIVASAVVAIQSWYKRETNNNILYPLEMRKLLIDTGTPQGNKIDGHIGPLPNVKNAIEQLQRTIAHYKIINAAKILGYDIDQYLRYHDVLIINILTRHLCKNIELPDATIMHEGKRIYIKNDASYGVNIQIDNSSIIIQNNESLSLHAIDNTWNIID